MFHTIPPYTDIMVTDKKESWQESINEWYILEAKWSIAVIGGAERVYI